MLVLEKQEAVLQEQEAVASLRKELEAVRLVRGKLAIFILPFLYFIVCDNRS